MEKDDEIKGGGNSYDFGNRILDVRLGRWLSIDAKAHEYPALSPYVHVANNPLYYVDMNGDEIWIKEVGKSVKYRYDNGKLYDKKGNLYSGETSVFVTEVVKDLDKLRALKDSELKNRFNHLQSSSSNAHTIRLWNKRKFNVTEATESAEFDIHGNLIKSPGSYGDGVGTNIYFEIFEYSGEKESYRVLAHELLGHSYDMDLGQSDQTIITNLDGVGIKFSDGEYFTQKEVDAVSIENMAAKEWGMKEQTHYSGIEISGNIYQWKYGSEPSINTGGGNPDREINLNESNNQTSAWY